MNILAAAYQAIRISLPMALLAACGGSPDASAQPVDDVSLVHAPTIPHMGSGPQDVQSEWMEPICYAIGQPCDLSPTEPTGCCPGLYCDSASTCRVPGTP